MIDKKPEPGRFNWEEGDKVEVVVESEHSKTSKTTKDTTDTHRRRDEE
jgi:hypothetical protein